MMIKALVVDDSPTVLTTISHMLMQAGMEVLTASDGLSAFSELQATVPDLILLDIGLPYINGMDLCAAIKHTPAYATVPVIIITGSHKHIDAALAGQLGAAAYITKPVSEPELMATIDECLLALA